jgi:hypothetical protein
MAKEHEKGDHDKKLHIISHRVGNSFLQRTSFGTSQAFTDMAIGNGRKVGCQILLLQEAAGIVISFGKKLQTGNFRFIGFCDGA